jgi:DNA-binding response OmpR family regulator
VRVVIVDPDLKAGRKLAASVEQMLPGADVLLYGESQEALAGIVANSPDVTFVAPQVGALDGPTFLLQAHDVTDGPKYVGLVDAPSQEMSTRYVEAGAHLVVARPVDNLGIRNALSHADGGVQ